MFHCSDLDAMPPCLSKFTEMDSRSLIAKRLVWSPTGSAEEGDERRVVEALSLILVADGYGAVSNMRYARDAYNRRFLALP